MYSIPPSNPLTIWLKMALNVYINGENYYFSNIELFHPLNMVFALVIQAFFNIF